MNNFGDRSPPFARFRKRITVFIRNFDDFTAMSDMFEGMQELPQPLAGVPNFRRVPSYKVYCCGQPSLEGFTTALEKVCGDTYPREGKVVWINTRQEPCVYVNGIPICARAPDKICKFAEGGNVTCKAVTRDERDFLKLCKSRAEDNGGKLKYQDVFGQEFETEVKELKTLEDVVEDVKQKFPGLVHIRVPMPMSAAPKEPDFDTIIDTLIGTGFNTPVIINDHIGDARATTGGIIACIFKEFQVGACYDGLIESIPGVDTSVLRMDKYKYMSTDPMLRGEFNAVMKLLTSVKGAEYAKKECDKIIDVNGTKETGGSGMVQLREDIARNKMRYELVEDSEQVILKAKIMDNIQKYFYLIVFTAYMREEIDTAKDDSVKEENALKSGKHAIPANELKVQKSFLTFMAEHTNLRDTIEEGKGDLKWERDIPEEDAHILAHMATEDFDKNLGSIINKIFEIAHSMFSDLTPGPDKKRATYRFASKTLLMLLPQRQRQEVDQLIAKKRLALDLYDILGHCTWKLG